MTNILLSVVSWTARLLPMQVKRQLYQYGALTGWLRGGLNRLAPEGKTTVTVSSGSLAGMQLSLDLQSEKDYWLGTYEPELQSTIEDKVSEGMVVYDIGANIGYFSLLLARKVDQTGCVFAFEALPANIQRLRTNVELNNLGSRVKIVPVAVIERERSARFGIGPSGAMGKVEGSAGRDSVIYSKTISVEGISLDEYVYKRGNPPPDVVKMDIEGGEVLALSGMPRVLDEAKPIIFLEIHGPDAAEFCWNILKDADYRVCSLQPGYPTIISLQEIDWKAYIVAIP